jgi:ribose 5-phosphate isomerase A
MDPKEAAGERAASLVRDGEVVGLGTGRTADCATRALAKRVAGEGLRFEGIVTSSATERLAKSLGLKLTTLDEHAAVDVTIDGADEVSPSKDLIKGLGGALLMEKVVARATKRYVIVADDGKLVDVLGRRCPVPVEILKFVTDCGNLIADCKFPEVTAPREAEAALNSIVGVVENGLFVGMRPTVVVGSASGVRQL